MPAKVCAWIDSQGQHWKQLSKEHNYLNVLRGALCALTCFDALLVNALCCPVDIIDID